MGEKLTVKRFGISEWTLKKLLIMLTWLIAYFSPISELVMFVGIVVFVDTMIGVAVAHKKKKFTSRKMLAVVYKTLIYLSAVVLSYLGEQIFDIGEISKITAGYIAFTELSSIDENAEKLTGKRVFGHLLDKIKRK